MIAATNGVVEREQGEQMELWGCFYGAGGAVYAAQRIDSEGVMFTFGDKKYRIALPGDADARAVLVGFDGFFLRHGIATRGSILAYEYLSGSSSQTGPEYVELKSTPDEVRRASKYEAEDLREPLDYYQFGETGGGQGLLVHARKERSERHFLSLPYGTRSLVCQLQPHSLERQYIFIQVLPGEVHFVPCNSY